VDVYKVAVRSEGKVIGCTYYITRYTPNHNNPYEMEPGNYRRASVNLVTATNFSRSWALHLQIVIFDAKTTPDRE